MPDFTYFTSYNPEAGIEIVDYGAQAQVLEVELNEMQRISGNQLSFAVSKLYKDGIIKTDNTVISYSSGTFTMSDLYVLVNGHLMYVSSLSLSGLTSGKSVYFDSWLTQVTSSDVLKKWGNQQESNTVSNWIGQRVATETSRRFQRQYNLTTTQPAHSDDPADFLISHDYIKIAEVGQSGITYTYDEVYSSITGKRVVKTFTADGVTTTYSLDGPGYDVDLMQVYVSGVLVPSSAYSAGAGVNTSIVFAAAPKAGVEIKLIV